MNLDYDDLDKATAAHDHLRSHNIRVTLFPNKTLSFSFRQGQSLPKVVHRVVVSHEDTDVVNALLKPEGLGPPDAVS